MIRAIIIDDEPSAVNVLALLLKKKCHGEVEIIATSNSSIEGKKLIEDLAPDLVFLDIEMPVMSGIDLLRSCENPSFRVVFVTAFDSYAVQAFRLSAFDYLLKPVEAADVIRVIEKVKQDIERDHNMIGARLHHLEELLKHNALSAESKIGIAMADKIVFVNISDILYCEADGSYSMIYLHDGKKITTTKTLGDFEEQLAGHNFFRIHHAHLINLNRVKEFQRHGGGYVVIENGQKLEVSQRRRKDFLEAIDDHVL